MFWEAEKNFPRKDLFGNFSSEKTFEALDALSYERAMNESVALTNQEAQYKERAEYYLAETQKILRQLAIERQRAPRWPRINLVEQVKKILYGK